MSVFTAQLGLTAIMTHLIHRVCRSWLQLFPSRIWCILTFKNILVISIIEDLCLWLTCFSGNFRSLRKIVERLCREALISYFVNHQKTIHDHWSPIQESNVYSLHQAHLSQNRRMNAKLLLSWNKHLAHANSSGFREKFHSTCPRLSRKIDPLSHA